MNPLFNYLVALKLHFWIRHDTTLLSIIIETGNKKVRKHMFEVIIQN